jgi:gas vesicle protein
VTLSEDDGMYGAKIERGGRMADQDYGSKAVWFLAGIAIGSTIALLYAPDSGEATRRKIARKTQEGRDALADSGREMFDRGKEMYERGRELADEAAEMFERGRKIVEGTAAKVRG